MPPRVAPLVFTGNVTGERRLGPAGLLIFGGFGLPRYLSPDGWGSLAPTHGADERARALGHGVPLPPLIFIGQDVSVRRVS